MNDFSDDKNVEIQTSQKKTFLERLQIATAIMVAILGAYTSIQSTVASQKATDASETATDIQIDLEKRAKENERKLEFSKSIRDQLDNIAGKDDFKARIALSSLYGIADGDLEKNLLVTVAMVSDNLALIETITQLIIEDPDVEAEFKNKIQKKLVNRTIKREKNNDEQNIDIASEPSLEVSSKTPTIEAEEEFLEQLTQAKINIEGWIYLGKSKVGSSILENNKTIKSAQIPSAKSTINTSTSINLRDDPANGIKLGSIIGRIGKNTKLTVKGEVTRVKIDENFEAIWAEISYDSAT